MRSAKSSQVEGLRKFYKGRKVLVTGVQGFKGSWLALLLQELGAEVTGLGLKSPTNSLVDLLELEQRLPIYNMDVRNPNVSDFIRDRDVDVAFHLAAQPIVSEGYQNPYFTYTTNVIGVVNFLEAFRSETDAKVRSVVNVTTDKVYQNVEQEEPYVEADRLMGTDPYSSSKSCSELVSYSYQRSFFQDRRIRLSTCRAGNVVGGGDFATDRVIPDMARAMKTGKPVGIRNFESVRPYEHVLDAVYAYVLLGASQYHWRNLSGAYNIGPNDESIMKTRELVDFFQELSGIDVVDLSDKESFHEAKLLSLDSGKFRTNLEWAPTWDSKEEILTKTYDWYDNWCNGGEVFDFTLSQVQEFLDD